MFELCQKYLDYAEYLYKDSVNLPGVGLDAAVVVVDGVAHVEQGEGDHEDQPRRSEGQSYHNIDNLCTKLIQVVPSSSPRTVSEDPATGTPPSGSGSARHTRLRPPSG